MLDVGHIYTDAVARTWWAKKLAAAVDMAAPEVKPSPKPLPTERELTTTSGEILTDSPAENRLQNVQRLIRDQSRHDDFVKRFATSRPGQRIRTEMGDAPTDDRRVTIRGIRDHITNTLRQVAPGSKSSMSKLQDLQASLFMLKAKKELGHLFDPRQEESIDAGEAFTGVADAMDVARGDKEWTPADWKSHRNEVLNRMRVSSKHMKVPDEGIMSKGWNWLADSSLADKATLSIPSLEDVAPAAAKGVLTGVEDMAKRAEQYIKANPNKTGFVQWLKKNPWSLAVPAALLMTVFGNTPVKILGLLTAAGGLGYGGYKLYNRYNNLMGSSAKAKGIQKELVRSLNYYDQEQGKFIPFGNKDQIKDPEVLQATDDFGFLARIGFMGDIHRSFNRQGQSLYERLMGPGAMGSEQFGAARKQLPPTLLDSIMGRGAKK